MVQGWIWKRAAALLAAAGLFAFLVGGISADDGNTEAVAARALKPTQAIADIPQEYNELFSIQWGGGSLYHLKARLATMGCMLNTIWVYDDNEWYAYNQYNVPHTFPNQQEFLQRYEDNIPVGTLYGSCIDICTFDRITGTVIESKECETFEYRREKGYIDEYRTILNLPIDDDTPCNYDFHPLVKQHIFQILPVTPNTCIVRQDTVNTNGVRGRIGGAITPYVVIWSNSANYIDREEKLRIVLLHTEIHELCHIQQAYYVTQQDIPHQNVYYRWQLNNSDAINSFLQLTEGEYKYERQEDAWIFKLPNNSIFKEIYSTKPVELSAELCTLYLLEKIGEKSEYEFIEANFNPQKYLTPQVVEWLEKYMVLPYPNYESE